MKIPASLPNGEGDDSPAGDGVDPAADDPRCGDRGEDSHRNSSSSSVMIDSRDDGGRQATLGEWAAPTDAQRGASPAAAVDEEPDGDDDADPGLDPDPEARIERNAADIETLSRTVASITTAIRGRSTTGECGELTPDRGFQ